MSKDVLWNESMDEFINKAKECGNDVDRDEMERMFDDQVKALLDVSRPEHTAANVMFITGQVVDETTEDGTFRTCDVLGKSFFKFPPKSSDAYEEFIKFYNELRSKVKGKGGKEIASAVIGVIHENTICTFEGGIPLGDYWGEGCKETIEELATIILCSNINDFCDKLLRDKTMPKDVIKWLLGCSIVMTANVMPEGKFAEVMKGGSE